MAKRDDEASRQSAEDRARSRRQFLKASGIAAGGLVIGGAAGGAIGYGIGARDDDHGFTPLAQRHEPGFDHVVVLMFENRSFDNLLGWLYSPDQLAAGQKFDGLNQGTYSNQAPDGTRVEAHVYTGATDEIFGSPDPDPGEFYPHVNTQLFGVVDPPGNADINANGIQAPYNAPPAGTAATMSGFVRDYAINFLHERGKEPTPEEYRVAMGSFSPDMLPVTSTIARNFTVYDHWHAGVPSQTFCNRSFFHASTSHGFVTNQDGGGYSKWLEAQPAPTIFNRLEEAGKSWRVYYDEDQLVSLTGILHAPVIERYWKTNFRGMKQFHLDAENGTLPDYAFIEPRMIFNHNDMHPPFGHLKSGKVDGDEVYNSAYSDVRAGEALLASVYNSIKGGESAKGSNAMNTALLITFDEHGGTFDHAVPPKAVPPTGDPIPGEMGFTFDRLGVRVPAILVSAYSRAGTVVNDEMHHGSVINTLCRLHGLTPLSQRDEAANSLFNGITLTKGRQPALWPDVHPAFVPKHEDTRKPHEKHKARPLTPPAKGVLGLLLAKYEPGAPIPETYGDAYDVLVKHGTGLFGVSDAADPEKPAGVEPDREGR
jgi:phospholipase C